jgi:hypothetical protein
MDPFDKQFFDSSGLFSAHMGDKGCIVNDDQAGGHCCWLDAGNWWIFCCTFLLLKVPIEQNMAGFFGWVTGVVADLFHWVVGVPSYAGDGVGLHPQVMEFASVRFLLVCGGSGVFPLHLADKYWPCYQSSAGVQYDVGLAERLQRRLLFIHALCLQFYMLDVARCHMGWQGVSALSGIREVTFGWYRSLL